MDAYKHSWNCPIPGELRLNCIYSCDMSLTWPLPFTAILLCTLEVKFSRPHALHNLMTSCSTVYTQRIRKLGKNVNLTSDFFVKIFRLTKARIWGWADTWEGWAFIKDLPKMGGGQMHGCGWIVTVYACTTYNDKAIILRSFTICGYL